MEKGWQRIILQAPLNAPLRSPYFEIASMVYWEQLGVKRHEGGKRGERYLLYALTSPIANLPGTCSPRMRDLCVAFQLFQCFPELPLKILVRSLGGRRPGGDYEVHLSAYLRELQAEDLTQPPLDAAANHRVANLLRDRQTEPGSASLAGESVDGDQLPPVRGSLFVYPLKLRGVRQPGAPAEPHGLDGKLLAPLTPTRGYHPPATYCLHPLAETVSLGTLATIRLVSTLHISLSPQLDFENFRLTEEVYPKKATPSSQISTGQMADYTRHLQNGFQEKTPA